MDIEINKIKKEKPLIEIIETKHEWRKLFGIPIALIVAIFLFVGLVGASVTLFWSHNTSVSSVVSAKVLSDNVPDTLNAVGGDNYTWNMTFENLANQPENFTLTFSMTNKTGTSIKDGDALLKILDGATELASSSTVVNNTITAVKYDYTLPGHTNVTITYKIQFNTSTSGNYTLGHRLDQGHFEFTI